jgi:hypothetical protein
MSIRDPGAAFVALTEDVMRLLVRYGAVPTPGDFSGRLRAMRGSQCVVPESMVVEGNIDAVIQSVKQWISCFLAASGCSRHPVGDDWKGKNGNVNTRSGNAERREAWCVSMHG